MFHLLVFYSIIIKCNLYTDVTYLCFSLNNAILSKIQMRLLFWKTHVYVFILLIHSFCLSRLPASVRIWSQSDLMLCCCVCLTSILCEFTFLPFLFQNTWGLGSPAAWHTNDTTPPDTPIWSVGILVNLGATATETQAPHSRHDHHWIITSSLQRAAALSYWPRVQLTASQTADAVMETQLKLMSGLSVTLRLHSQHF